jgi:MFS family permease
MSQPISQSRRIWTLVIVSLGLFMTVLDNLVVNVALPSIHRDLGASIQTLEWTVNAYVLAYAVLLLTGAALGDRVGRKRMFMVGIGVFTAGSVAAALSPSIGFLIAARSVQGVGAALVTPLTLTLLAEAFPPAQRGLALGVWSAISGIGVAAGPLVGGALTQVASWHLSFWVNVPIGLARSRSPAPAWSRAAAPPRASTSPASYSCRPACSASSLAWCARSRWAGATRRS